MSERRTSTRLPTWAVLTASLVLGTLSACGDGEGNRSSQGSRTGAGRRPARESATGASAETDVGIPVEVALVERRAISSFLETNGTLEAERDVQIVARISGPIVELEVEEGMDVHEGDLLARLDDRELQARTNIAEVALEEAERAYDRARISYENEVISREVYEQALARLESAEAQLRESQILLGYSRIVAPFDGIVVERHVKLAETVGLNQELFRIVDFDPLLCPIQVPEQDRSKVQVGQPAHLTVEAWPEQRFEARVLRISPIVDSETGTVKVTLEVKREGKLTPGMFASVFLVIDRRPNALAIPKSALSLESLGNTVFVVNGDVVERRDVELGYEESKYVEVRSGLDDGESVVVVGQDGLSDGTPINIFDENAGGVAEERIEDRSSGARPDPDVWSGKRRRRVDRSKMSPEQLEAIRERMRERGMSEEQVERFLERRLERSRQR